MEALEESWELVGRNAGSRVRYLQLDVPVQGSDLDGNSTFEGELEGIGDEIENDLLPHFRIVLITQNGSTEKKGESLPANLSIGEAIIE